LAVVKRNRQELYPAIDWLFQTSPIPADQEVWHRTQTASKGHGRLEIRTLECSVLADYLSDRWPDVQQVVQRTCVRQIIKTGKVTTSVHYGITSLAVTSAGAVELEQLWRGHWTIENRLHYVGDVTMGEDAGEAYRPNTPHVLAALRNSIINLLRRQGWTNMADAFGHYAASLARTLELIGARPARL
jgi:predicted transposase YbfD/YdcC